MSQSQNFLCRYRYLPMPGIPNYLSLRSRNRCPIRLYERTTRNRLSKLLGRTFVQKNVLPSRNLRKPLSVPITISVAVKISSSQSPAQSAHLKKKCSKHHRCITRWMRIWHARKMSWKTISEVHACTNFFARRLRGRGGGLVRLAAVRGAAFGDRGLVGVRRGAPN